MFATAVILVHVVGDGLDVVVNVPIKMPTTLPVVASALDHVPQVRDDAGGDEGLPAAVEIQPPRIARAPREDLEFFLGGMIPPHASIERHAVLVRRAGLADLAVREHAV